MSNVVTAKPKTKFKEKIKNCLTKRKAVFYFKLNSHDNRTGTISVNTKPLMKEYIPTCRLVYFITTGSPLSIVAAPLGASASSLCTRTKSGIKKNADSSLNIFAKKDTVPISVLYMALITTDEKLYQPKPLPTSTAS